MAFSDAPSFLNFTPSPAEVDVNSSAAPPALPCSDWPPLSMTTAIPAIFSVVSVLGTVANTLAVCVLGQASASRTTVANTFMLNLCVSDLLFLLSLPFWAVYYALGYSWPFGRITCKLCDALLNFNLYASIFFITCMSVDRYLAIVHPLRFQNSRNPRRARLVCVLVWLLACACSSPSLYLRDTHHIKELAVEACAIIYPNHAWYITLVLMKIILAFLVPLIIISCCYCAIGRHLMADRGLETTQNQGHPHKKAPYKSLGSKAARPPAVHVSHRASSSKSLEGRRLERVLWTVTTVVVAFFLCWFPFHCMTFLDLLRSEGWLDSCWVTWTIRNLTPLTLSLGFTNSAINPVLYCFVGNHFRGRLGGLCKSFCACLKAPGEDHSQKRGSFSTRLSSFSQKLSDLKDLAIMESPAHA